MMDKGCLNFRMTSMRWHIGLLFLAVAVGGASAARGGHCPALNQWGVCPSPLRPCSIDEECRGREKCCMSPCGRACVSPLFTGCEQLRSESMRRARALGGRHHVKVPNCDQNGAFEKIQCEFNDLEAEDTACWCVDAAGFEIAGTRAPSRREVNCSDPKPCAGHTCRMLCPYGFELSPEDGCPICQCHDPCAGVSCPGSLECQLEEAACLSQPCPPIPTCKRARSLDNICPLGPPLKVDGERPFLCGTTPGKPQCPPLFQCLVQSGNDYGVCCSSSMQLEKHGACPAEEEEEGELYREEEGELESIGRSICDGSLCEYDLHCPNGLKCCGQGKGCGKRCTTPQNMTICLQQRMLAQLLSSEAEREGHRGYVPQCSPSNGLFLRRQCSRNRLVCWCVDPMTGVKDHGSMGPAQNVKCSPFAMKTVSPSNELGVARSGARSLCDTRVCAQLCEFGFKSIPGDECPSCECEDNPCADFKCGPDEECVTAQSLPHCPLDDPLCGSLRPTCQPKKNLPETSLAAKPQDEETKEDQDGAKQPEFQEDGHEASQDDLENRSTPTMCEYLRDFSSQMEASKDGMSLAVPIPSCNTTDGSYDAMQCEVVDGMNYCWCVDDFGTEIPRTRAIGGPKEECVKLREKLDCLGLTCRLGCDFGFVLDNGDELGRTEEERMGTRCPKCECRDPCLGASLPGGRCGPEYDCLLAEVECQPGDYCPPVPSCVRKRPGQCPYLVPPGTGSCEYQCRTDQHCNGTAKCCSNGCGTQCVQPLFLSACQHQRAVMEQRARENGIPARRVFLPDCLEEGGGFAPVQCHPLTKECWCVNVGGIEIPGTKTTNGIRPKCPSGPFMPLKQTDEIKPDTDVKEPEGESMVEFIDKDIQSSECPKYKCTENCPHGRLPDSRGCPTCTCYDPCKQSIEGKGKVKCGEGEECRAIRVQCVDEPCPPVALCLPRASNPCVSSGGHPLLLVLPPVQTNSNSSKVVTCGPEGDACPSSHKCHLSPFGEYAVCCPKTKESCLEPVNPGRKCFHSTSKKWRFNAHTKRCEQFLYEGCGGNLNNFDSQEACRLVCPAPTKCERARLRSEQLAQRLSKLTSSHAAAGVAATFVPRCVDGSGAWEPAQCLDGANTPLCWCVDPISGTPIKGTIAKRKLEGSDCMKQPPVATNVARRRSGKAHKFEREWFELEEEMDQTVDQVLQESSEVEVKEFIISPTTQIVEEVISTTEKIVEEPPKPLTRCQAMQQNGEELSAGEGGVSVICDRDGRFLPMQCYSPMRSSSGETYQECWCVDEAGNQLPNTTTFKRGSTICLPTPIETVEIRLGFQGNHAGMKKKAVIASVRDILSKLGAKIKADAIEVESRPLEVDGDSIHVQFSLIGPNKVDVAYQLEQMVRAKQVAVEVEKSPAKDKESGNPERKDEGVRKMIAEITSSYFSHRPVSSHGQRVIALEHREILLSDSKDESNTKESPLFGSRSLNGGGNSSVVTLLGICVISSFIICILSVLLMVQRVRVKNNRWWSGTDQARKGVVMGDMEDGGSYYKKSDVIPTSQSTPAPIFVLTPDCLKESGRNISNSDDVLSETNPSAK